jgi:hypothetical protein
VTGRERRRMMMDLKEARHIVKELDPGLRTTDDAFKAALVLLAAVEVGVDAEKIYKFTEAKVSQLFIGRCFDNLRRSGIFEDDKIHHSGWFDKESGWISFWLDVAVAQGLVKRTS